jgi:hypothetical protein
MGDNRNFKFKFYSEIPNDTLTVISFPINSSEYKFNHIKYDNFVSLEKALGDIQQYLSVAIDKFFWEINKEEKSKIPYSKLVIRGDMLGDRIHVVYLRKWTEFHYEILSESVPPFSNPIYL